MCMSKFSLINGNCTEHTPTDVGIGLEIIYILSGLFVTNPPIRLMSLTSFCPSVCPSTFLFLDSNLKTLCPIEFNFGREIDHPFS